MPALFDNMVDALEGKEVSQETLRQEGAQRGHMSRMSGYAITQVTWEFAIFPALLRETLEELAAA